MLIKSLLELLTFRPFTGVNQAKRLQNSYGGNKQQQINLPSSAVDGPPYQLCYDLSQFKLNIMPPYVQCRPLSEVY